MFISNVKVYDMAESIVASGYPMDVDLSNKDEEIKVMKDYLNINSRRVFTTEEMQKADKRFNKAKDLAKLGNAHAQFLSGVRVAFDLTCSNKMWVELERYRFITFVSSQSTMHRISKFNLADQYVKYVDPRIITIMEELKDNYNKTNSKEDYLKLLYSNPCGFQLTARLTTNYRCLHNVFGQRHDHRLPEWRQFVREMGEKLPYAKDLIL
jgi:hypothetical protein